MSIVNVRQVKVTDLPQVAEIMHDALDPYYGGDHRAHAKRIVETASAQGNDSNGHFSREQIMYVAETNGRIIGILNFVIKYQGTMKISPLIVLPDSRGNGLSKRLMQKALDYATQYHVRQVYCTIAQKNKIALSYFEKHGFIRAGVAVQHYRTDMDEIMLYKIVEHFDVSVEEPIISVVPMEEDDKEGVRRLVLSRLSPYFDGVDDRWVDALFAGYDRRHSNDPNEKYKLIWVAKSKNGDVLGIAAATPKKGNPIKLMPMVANDIQAFSALLVELPYLLKEYGHKLYTHMVPSDIEVESLQHYGWHIEAMMPEAYKKQVITQQWGVILKGKIMKKMRVKRQHFNAIMVGTKFLEVRVAYPSIKKILKGDNIQLECGRESGIVQVIDIREYKSFVDMLNVEKADQVVPDEPSSALSVLRGIYPPDKEALGVVVLELRPVS